jgi:uncharacterized protein YyaL (SSP411 family)
LCALLFFKTDSLPEPNATKKREGAYYVWTAKEIDNVLNNASKDNTAINKDTDTATATTTATNTDNRLDVDTDVDIKAPKDTVTTDNNTATVTSSSSDISQIVDSKGNIVSLTQLFKTAYGVRSNGNCDANNDPHGELKGQNVLYQAKTPIQLIGIYLCIVIMYYRTLRVKHVR